MRRVLGAVGVSCALIVTGFAVSAPAEAAGGPPSITAFSPGSVPADGTVTITGTGCDAASPISFYLWNTSGGLPIYKDSTQTGWSANSAGEFTRAIDLDNALSVGQIGLSVSCTSTYDWTVGSDPVEDGSYAIVTPAAPTVEVAVATRAAYGSRPTVTVTTRRATGTISLELDGTVVHTAGSGSGGTSYRLPASLALGSHQLKATFDEAPPAIPAVVDTATVTVVKVAPVVKLSRAKKTVRSGKNAKLSVVLNTGLAPATGTVQIKEGKKVLKTRTLKAADHSRATIKVKLTKTGKHKLKAKFLGNAYADRATSSKVKVTVIRA